MYSFTIEHKDKYRSTIDFLTKEKIEKNYADKIKRNFDMVSNMGRGNMELHVQPIGKFQKIVNLYLLVLSYSVLSFGGILGFDIIDIGDIIKEEKKIYFTIFAKKCRSVMFSNHSILLYWK